MQDDYLDKIKATITTIHEGDERQLEVIFSEDDRVIVEGVNICKRHMRPQQQGGAGQIVSKEAAIAASNVMLICPKCKRGVRVGYQVLENGNKVRVCKKCGTTID